MNRCLLFLLISVLWVQFAWCGVPTIDIENSPQFLKSCGTPTGMVLSGSLLDQLDIFVYVSGFDAASPSGSLRKYAISRNGDGLPELAAVPQWDAADILTGINGNGPRPSPQARNIFVGKLSGNTWTTVKFNWDALSDAQRSMLNNTSIPKEATGLQRLEYLRGVRILEAGQPNGMLRKRDRLIGDIVNSIPVYVGEPALNIQGLDYQAFHTRYKSRRKAIYVGANDGMLHAFSAEDGTELFSYIPNALLPELSSLTRKDYRHRPYADGRLTVAEAQLAGSWRTILAAGMGGGAQGVVALDATDPEDFLGGRGAIWEFSDGDDPDMGNVIGMPMIAKFRLSNAKDVPRYGYFVVVANGVNSYRSDGKGRFNSEAAGALFLLALDKPLSEKWQLGVNYFKFKTPSMDPTLPGGLISPAAVTGEGGIVQSVYAGDLQGNLWRFDFADGMPKQNASTIAAPLFVAMDEKGKRQPISTQPGIVFSPDGGYVVLFGTGKFLEQGDTAAVNFSKQSFYGIYDSLQKGYRVSGRSELAQRSMNKTPNDAIQVSGSPFPYGSTAESKKGWYLDLSESEVTGERIVTDPTLVSRKVFFNSLIPGGTCADKAGRSYALDALTGLMTDALVTGRRSDSSMHSPPLLLNIGLETGNRNAVGKTIAKRKYVVVDFPNSRTDKAGGTAGRAVPDEVHQIVLPARRFSWREVINWPELRAAAIKK